MYTQHPFPSNPGRQSKLKFIEPFLRLEMCPWVKVIRSYCVGHNKLALSLHLSPLGLMESNIYLLSLSWKWSEITISHLLWYGCEVSSQMGHMLKACLTTGKWLDRQGVYLLSGLIPQWFTWCYYWEVEKGEGALEKAPIVPGPLLSFWPLAAKSEQLLLTLIYRHFGSPQDQLMDSAELRLEP